MKNNKNSNLDYKKIMNHINSLPVVALMTTGRTGSDYLHSLLDSHPQVLTFNGHFTVYSDFFSTALTIKNDSSIIADIVDEFIGKYIYKFVSKYDYQEAKDILGKNKDESITINTSDFKRHVIQLMKDENLSSRNLLLAFYGSYNICLGNNIFNTKVFFHHPHVGYELDLFINDFSDLKIVFTTRDPRANFVSNIENFRRYSLMHDNEVHLYNAMKIMLEDCKIDEIHENEDVVIKLEDLPKKNIMESFANWLQIDFRESMLNATWAGLEWYGDRLSTKKYKSSYSNIDLEKMPSHNNWENRLSKKDKYIFNYILNSRLKFYGYSYNKIYFWDSIFVFFLIPFLFKYEFRYISYSY
ncbi:sulfotransferase, partial [Candidatus Marinimicrobia bacterium]|nr:sulfotransferase [Candidatus Neomarinimicrobiota bacterium]